MPQDRLLFAAVDGVLNLVTVPKDTRPKAVAKGPQLRKVSSQA